MICLISILVSLANQEINRLPEWALGGFTRAQGINPVLQADANATFLCPMRNEPIPWESGDVFNPASTVRKGRIFVLFRAEDQSGVGIGSRTSRIGLAETADGRVFKKRPTPVLYPALDAQKANEWPGGCEDPRVGLSQDGTYVMTYTQWNRQRPRLAIATSKDLVHWRKYGPAFRGKFGEMATKSASIVTEVLKGRQVIVKIHGKYWMYWGEDAVHAATSEDLVSWTPVVDESGELITVIRPRTGYFDSELTECGPPAVLTKEGIVLLYNGKNRSGTDGDPRFGPESYSAGEVLIRPDQPLVAVDRLPVPFFRPMEPFEKSGQYGAGTVFVEGLSFFKGKWFLYYGCADSRVGEAVFDPQNRVPGDKIPLPEKDSHG